MNSQVEIRDYNASNFQCLVSGMKFLQEYLVAVDNHHLIIMNDGYPEAYTQKTLIRVKNNHGKIFCAFSNDRFLGCVIGIIEDGFKYNPDDPLQDFTIGKTGEVIELIVLPESRGIGIGKLLMQAIEGYFLDNNCKFSYLDVFGPNKLARDFYIKGQYEERMVTMIKQL